ncbi:MAG: carboxypeptidase-like regulatory domain-containing protein [Planctomycetota bacterium]
MSSRQILLLIGTLAVMAVAGVLVLNLPDDLGDSLPGDGGPGDELETPIDTPPDDGGGGNSVAMQGDPGVVHEPGKIREQAENDNTPLEAADATAGTIDGRIALDTSILGKFNTYTVEVIEEVNENARRSPDAPQPFRKAQRFAYDNVGTPFFTVVGIPFSRHGYLVRLHVPELNGGQARVHITKDKPFGKVTLGLMPGVIFSVLLRDQRQTPREGLSVQMIPEGDPPARPVYRKISNNFGQVIFEKVVQGDYKIYVGRLNAPMNVPKKITVLPVNAVFSKDSQKRVHTQSTIVVVPSGAPVTVEVTDRYGYGVADAELEIHQIEVQRYFSYKGKTGADGRHVFEHLPVGKYQLSVHKPGFGRRTQKVQIKAEDRTKQVKVALRR